MTNIEDVILDAALKNRVGLKEDDPLMVLVTIMNRIVLDWQSTMDAALEANRNESEELAQRWRWNATKRAEKTITAALDAGRRAMAKGMDAGSAKVIEYVRAEMDAAIAAHKAELEKTTQRFRRYSLWMLAANGAMMLVALFIAACL